MAHHNELGAWGEDKAVRFLVQRGCKILARNYRSRYGEIDIIAEDGQEIAFVEVRLRSSTAHGRPEETVDYRKQRKLRLTAEYFLMKNPTGLQPRFDVIALYAVNGEATVPLPVRYIKNAF